MRIAQISPLFESVPPKLYGGTERIVHTLTETLVDLGHEVTLFASRDSKTSAELVSIHRDALRPTGCAQPLIPHFLLFEKLRALQDQFDIVHFHTEYMHLPLARSLKVPTVSTIHGRQDLEDYQEMYAEYRDLPMISISMHQRKPIPQANWVGLVHHGIEASHLRFHERGQGYLAFLGRLSPEKGFEHAVEIAKRTGFPLKVAAKIEPSEYPVYWKKIEPLLGEAHVEYVGEIGDDKKSEFLGNANALLFPILWPEPFGLVMIESFAVGTPVIAFRNGSVPEIIRPGRNGFIVDTVAEACQAVHSLPMIDRHQCHRDFNARFSARRMAEDYVAIYDRVCKNKPGVRGLAKRALSEAPGRMH